jgi:hypothetical protein
MTTVSVGAPPTYHTATLLSDIADLLRTRGVNLATTHPSDNAQRHARGLLRALGVKPSSRTRSPRPRRTDPIPQELFETPPMRAALARRDIAAVFKRLQSSGISQRRIAAWTGQAQSEISEILHGRQVNSVEVLDRIAAGFGISPAWLGLGYDRQTRAFLVAQANERGER